MRESGELRTNPGWQPPPWFRQAGVWSKGQTRSLLAVRAVPDTLSQGGDREPSRWPRRVAAAAVLALAAVLIVEHLPRSGHPAASPTHPAATVTAPATSGAAEPVAAVAVGPNGITGPALSWPGELRLLAAEQRPAWFSPGSGRVAPIGGLPAERSGYEFTRAAGGWAIQADPAAQAACGSCAGPPHAVYFLADGARSVTRVGLANAVAPAATAGALWLTSYPSDADPATAAGTAREVSTTGTPLGAPPRLPAGYQIDQGTDRGLLLTLVAPRPGAIAYRLWDPAAPRAIRAYDAVLAVSATQLVWTPPCTARCGIEVVNLATGRQVTAELPAGRAAVNAAFSPDSRFLAVETTFSNEGDDGGQAVQLELVSTASGHLAAVPGTFLSSDALISFGWPTGGDSLVAELGFTTKVQLMSWRPGAARLAVAELGTRRSPASLSLIIGQYAP